MHVRFPAMYIYNIPVIYNLLSTSFAPQSSSFGEIAISSNKSDMYFSIKRFFALIFEKMHLVNTYTYPHKHTIYTPL